MILDIKSSIMDSKPRDKKDLGPELENRLRERRRLSGFSQKQLGEMAGITRQAVCALEAGQYSPATSVALQLARVLRCRVEDLFSLKSDGEMVEAEVLGPQSPDVKSGRVQLAQVGERLLVRPLDGSGELTSLSATADGVIVGSEPRKSRVKVRLLTNRGVIVQKIVVAGCDPAMFLAAQHLSKRDKESLVPCLMGSSAALAALKRGEAHVAGVHLLDEQLQAWNLPRLQNKLAGIDCLAVTFAHWEAGLMVSKGNPNKIRCVADLSRRGVAMVNREIGSGARQLLDRQLKLEGIHPNKLNGYKDEVFSHLEVAWRIKAGLADGGIGIRAAAAIFGIDFVPLRRERYDLIIPRIHYDTLPGVKAMLDTVVSGSFRAELEALGGYDTGDSGKIVDSRHS
jgi:putative molybdopterin biosynthesis protein